MHTFVQFVFFSFVLSHTARPVTIKYIVYLYYFTSLEYSSTLLRRSIVCVVNAFHFFFRKSYYTCYDSTCFNIAASKAKDLPNEQYMKVATGHTEPVLVLTMKNI